MKKTTLKLFILCCAVLLAGNLFAQREIRFTYDDAGNMENRFIYMPPAPIEDETNDTTGLSDLTKDEKSDALNDKLGEQEINIYPNPTKGKLLVDIPQYEGSAGDCIEIFDMQGVLKKRVAPLSESNTIYIDSYPAATYIMLIKIKGQSTEWKIIKQ